MRSLFAVVALVLFVSCGSQQSGSPPVAPARSSGATPTSPAGTAAAQTTSRPSSPTSIGTPNPASTVSSGQCPLVIPSRAVTLFDTYVMNADGSNPHKIWSDHANFPHDPAWSPDGQWIALAGEQDNHAGIFAIRPDGSGAQRLTENGGDSEPTWSPDGAHIAFERELPGKHTIFVMDAGGGNAHPVTNGSYDEDPLWSPKDSRIVFSRVVNDNVDVYVMDADGSNVRRLTGDPALDGPVAWSPDGRQILFSSSRGSRPGTYQVSLYLMNADGSDVRRLALGPDLTGWASWSPDGKRILFASSRSGSSDIYVADADGSNLHDLTNSRASDSTPNWSPDGKQIVFESDRAYRPVIGPRRDGWPEPIVLRAGTEEQSGGFGPFCWVQNESDPLGVVVPDQPLRVAAGDTLQLDFGAIGTPLGLRVAIYDYATALSLGKLAQGALLQPCAPPGGTEQGCLLRQYQPAPSERVPLTLDLSPGRYVLVASAGFAKGRTEQGFSIVVH